MASEQEKEFYHDLDDHKPVPNKPRRFTIGKFLTVFLIILMIAEGALFYVGYKFKQDPVDELPTKPTSSAGMDFSRVDLSDQQTQIIVSEGILCSKIYDQFKRDLSCQISSDGVAIAGKISAALPSNASIVFMPVAENGKVRLNVQKATVGSVEVPQFLVFGVKNAFEKVIYAQTQDLKVSRVDLESSLMVIITDK